MPEHRAHQTDETPYEMPFDPDVSPLTYGDVLADPNTHEALHPHLQRLIASEVSVPEQGSENLHDATPANEQQLPLPRDKFMDDVIDRLEGHGETAVFDPRKAYDDLWSLASNEMAKVMEEADYPADQVGDLLHATMKLEKWLDEYNARRDDMVEWSTSYNFARKAMLSMPDTALRELYFTEDGDEALKQVLKVPERSSSTRANLEILRRVYDCDQLIDLMEPNSAPQHDTLVREKLGAPSVKNVLASELTHVATWEKRGSPERISSAQRNYADRYLELVAGVSLPLRNDILFTAHSRTSNQETGFVKPAALQALLTSVAEKVDALGEDKLLQLHEEAGIVNLDYYTVKQLELMSKLVQGDEETIKHLQAGDVTAVFIDGKGDYNGAFKYESEYFATPSERTLFFEINDPTNLDKFKQLLEERDIHPSTMVLSAHGSPGGLQAGDFDNSNHFPESMATTSITRELARMANETMQDSRGIDDDLEAMGGRRLILAACLQEAAAEVWYTPPRGVEPSGADEVDHPKMIKREESSAETLLRMIDNPLVDVYAGDKPLSLKRTAGGIRMHEHYDDLNGVDATRPMRATRLRMDNQGNVIRQYVDEITLRRSQEPVLEAGDIHDDFA